MRSKATKISKLLQAPIRFLCKARDSYVKGMLGFAGTGSGCCGGIGGGAGHLPKSFSVNSAREVDEEEFRQHIRLLSKSGSEVGSYRNSKGCSGLKKSYSVGLGKIGRIDEDRPCSFREDVNANLYPRSTSHAIRRKIVYH